MLYGEGSWGRWIAYDYCGDLVNVQADWCGVCYCRAHDHGRTEEEQEGEEGCVMRALGSGLYGGEGMGT